ncbi:MAG: tetraacyldisaccharide 4'-kinase [Deltaproteobacteria bacterium]|nr:tetraacyldisaccharide 4'-kinase [Deltaproteobacteria bacterium]
MAKPPAFFYANRIPPWLRLLLFPLVFPSALYSLFMRWRARRWLSASDRRPANAVPVIGVGNLTVGGTGKTPISMYLAERLRSAGRRPAIVTRGYRGTLEGSEAVVRGPEDDAPRLEARDAGDEAFMMASRLAGVPVVIGARRPEAVALAARECGADVVICDDAFQHLRLRRDLDVLCVNGELGFGNGLTLPFGPLREPLSAASRAHLVLVNNDGSERAEIESALRDAGCTAPVVRWHYRAECFIPLESEQPIPLSDLKGGAVHALAATAAPERFFRFLMGLGLDVVATTARDDHHTWHAGDFRGPARIVEPRPFDYHVATEKDAAKLRGLSVPDGKPVLILRVEPEFTEEDSALIGRLLEESL